MKCSDWGINDDDGDDHDHDDNDDHDDHDEMFRLRDCPNVLRAGGCHQGFDDDDGGDNDDGGD